MEPGLARPLFPGAGKSDSSSRGPVPSSRPPPTPMPSFKGQTWGQSPVDWSNRPGDEGAGARGWGGEFWARRIVQSGCTKLHPFLLLASESQIGLGSQQTPLLAVSKMDSGLLQPVEDPSWVFCPAVQP